MEKELSDLAHIFPTIANEEGGEGRYHHYGTETAGETAIVILTLLVAVDLGKDNFPVRLDN